MVQRYSEFVMPFSVVSVGRLFLAAALVCLSVAACGRRGALEAPPDPAVARPAQRTSAKVERAPVASDPAVASLEADEDESPAESAAEAIVPSPSPTRTKRSRNFTIPKEPFILDPLL